VPRSHRALTLYTSDRLRCYDRYIRCLRLLAVKPLNSPPATYSQQVSVYCDGSGVVLDCGLWLACHRFVYNYTTVVGYTSVVVSCVAASLAAIIMSSHNRALRDCGLYLKKNQGALAGGSLGGGKGWLKVVRFDMTSESKNWVGFANIGKQWIPNMWSRDVESTRSKRQVMLWLYKLVRTRWV